MQNVMGKIKTLLRPIKHSIENLKEVTELKVIPVVSKSGFLSSFFYTFFSTQFYREHKAVLSGRVAYAKSLNVINESSALLRRNTHRLEKGLIMRPRRPMFAADYIGETVSSYRLAVQSDMVGEDEKRWATDVLNAYFEAVEMNDITTKYKQIFYSCRLEFDNTWVPYKYDELSTKVVSYEQLLSVFKRRRSVRWYEDKKVPTKLIVKAIEAATLAPSACNRQPFRFVHLTDKEKVEKVASFAMGTAGWIHSIQNLIVVVGSLEAYPKERDRHVIYIDGSLAAMQFMLACVSLDLATCPINWPDVEQRENKMDKALHLKPYERPIMLISVGYPDPSGKIPYSAKKASNVLLKEIK